MRLTRAIGLCLIATFAIGAAVTASASAELPALYECHKLTKNTVTKKFEGKYEKGCKVENAKGEGVYEVQEGVGKGKAFKGKGSIANLEVQGQSAVACLSSADKGKFATPKVAKGIEVIFKGCEVAGIKCTSTGKTGEIKTNKLEAEVGYVSGKGTKSPIIGALIRAEPPETYDAQFKCGDLNVKVTGGVIGLAKPINEFSKTAILQFKEAAGVQAIEKFEEGLPQTLLTQECKGCEGGAEDVSAESTEVTNTGEELMLKA